MAVSDDDEPMITQQVRLSRAQIARLDAYRARMPHVRMSRAHLIRACLDQALTLVEAALGPPRLTRNR
jgi:hypothetical protein